MVTGKEPQDTAKPILLYEAKVLRLLASTSEGIPQIYYAGMEGQYNLVVTELLGPSLLDLRKFLGTKFTIQTTLILAIETLKVMQHVHDRGFVHRDTKPANFCVGQGLNSDRIYLIDFGLAKKYLFDKSNDHVSLVQGGRFAGSLRYCSIAAHRGETVSRRDDLESLAYTLIDLGVGELPWRMNPGQNKQSDIM